MLSRNLNPTNFYITQNIGIRYFGPADYLQVRTKYALVIDT